MAQERTHRGIRICSLVSAGGEVRADVVPELGGTVSSLQLPGPDGAPRECLFRHPWFWETATEETRGGIPVLFPICGRLLQDGVPGRYHVGEKPFVLPIHGFAMRRPWQVLDASRSDALALRLADTADTRAMYPFAFELQLDFRAGPDGLDIRLTVRNIGDSPMPYHAGFHPYFATPPPGAGKEECIYTAAPRARWLYNETRTAVLSSAPAPRFPLSIGDGDSNGLLLEMGVENETRLQFPDGFVLRQTADEIFRCRQLYTLPREPFFCDEPWMAPPGSMDRPGAARLLLPDHAESASVRIAGGP